MREGEMEACEDWLVALEAEVDEQVLLHERCCEARRLLQEALDRRDGCREAMNAARRRHGDAVGRFFDHHREIDALSALTRELEEQRFALPDEAVEAAERLRTAEREAARDMGAESWMARMADEASEDSYAALSSARLAFHGTVRAVERCQAAYMAAYAAVQALGVAADEEAHHLAIALRIESDESLTELERSLPVAACRTCDDPN